MDVSAAAQIVDAQIGPVLSSAGFADATLGSQQDRMQVLYCADKQAILRKLPGLPDGTGRPPVPGSCFDVMVELQGGRVTDVHMDGGSLDGGLDLFGMAEVATRLRRVLGSSVEEAAPVVAEGVTVLFVNCPKRIASGPGTGAS